ncbi:MAG: NAD(P)H-binding protein [Burkholderiaceae bacterium]|nr:NAD(P)H-binding protein [Burkholderiaceae bacterium]
MPDALLAGATGLVGQALVQAWATHGTGASLHLLVRRPVSQPAAACPVHVVDFSALPALPAAREAYCCLGTTIKVAGSQDAFRAVDHDAVLAFAHAARAAGVQRLAVVSALGANPRSSNFYSRVKGETEAALVSLGFTSLVIARPSLLLGDRAALGQPERRGELIGQAITQRIGRLIPGRWRPIAADVVARALLRSLQAPAAGVTVLESAMLQRLGR